MDVSQSLGVACIGKNERYVAECGLASSYLVFVSINDVSMCNDMGFNQRVKRKQTWKQADKNVIYSEDWVSRPK